MAKWRAADPEASLRARPPGLRSSIACCSAPGARTILIGRTPYHRPAIAAPTRRINDGVLAGWLPRRVPRHRKAQPSRPVAISLHGAIALQVRDCFGACTREMRQRQLRPDAAIAVDRVERRLEVVETALVAHHHADRVDAIIHHPLWQVVDRAERREPAPEMPVFAQGQFRREATEPFKGVAIDESRHRH